MIVKLEIGDRWSDGHGKYEHFRFTHNLDSNSALQKAYNDGSIILGHDIVEEVAEEYQDHILPEDILEALLDNGVLTKVETPNKHGPEKVNVTYHFTSTKEGYDHAYSYSDTAFSNCEFHAYLWLEVARLGNPSLEYTSLKEEQSETIAIGGYGYFE